MKEKTLVIKDGQITLEESIAKQLVDFEKLIKSMEKQRESIKEQILSAMAEHGVLRVETPELIISYVSSSYRESFDTKRFKEENKDLYDEYVRLSPLKDSIRIRVKEEARDE